MQTIEIDNVGLKNLIEGGSTIVDGVVIERKPILEDAFPDMGFKVKNSA